MNRVDLVVPGLFNLPVYGLEQSDFRRQLPWLHRLFRFADKFDSQHFDLDEILIHRLGLEQQGLPYTHALEHPTESPMLLFRPVHLKTDINDALVFPVDEEPDHIDLLINDLSEYFKVDCDIRKSHQNLWSMRLHRCRPLSGLPHYLSATGRKVTHYLEQAKSHLEWFKLINEMQMYLYQHAINQSRFQAGLPMINSLWCWGSDEYQGEFHADLHWYSDDPLMLALGRLYCGHAHPVTSLDIQPAHKTSVIVELGILRALKGEDGSETMTLLQRLQEKYIQPLMQTPGLEIRITAGGDKDLVYRPTMAWKLWKSSDYQLFV